MSAAVAKAGELAKKTQVAVVSGATSVKNAAAPAVAKAGEVAGAVGSTVVAGAKKGAVAVASGASAALAGAKSLGGDVASGARNMAGVKGQMGYEPGGNEHADVRIDRCVCCGASVDA